MKTLHSLVLVFLISIAYSVSSQETTLEPATTDKERKKDISSKEQIIYNGLILIPFEPKLYMSDIDREIAQKEQLSFNQIRDGIRKGIADNIYIDVQQYYPTISMLSSDPKVDEDLKYIYNSIGYQYKIVPPDSNIEEKTTRFDKVLKKLSSKEKEEAGTYIKEGQIVTTYDNQQKYMGTTIVNPNLLNYLYYKYDADLFLFINQLDIKIAPSSTQTDIASENYQREIKVHYTILDRNGAEIYGGIATSYFSSKINDLNRIIKTYFPDIAKQISARLPLPITSKEMQEKREEEKKKDDEMRKNIFGDE